VLRELCVQYLPYCWLVVEGKLATVEIDFDVFKELTARRKTEATTYNDVIRELMGMPPACLGQSVSNGWVQKGVCFPDGTQFRAVHNGITHTAEVKGHHLVMNGRRMSSLSSAAHAATQEHMNGWRFWHCRLPNSTEYVLVDTLKR
jgi:hypothetical protein